MRGITLGIALSLLLCQAASARVADFAAQDVDLELTVTGPSEVQVNTQARFDVTVKNLGPGTAPNTTQFQIINTQTWRRVVSLSASQGTCTTAGSAPSCDPGPIPNGTSVQITAVYEADSTPRDDGNITFQVNTYNSDSPDPNTSNNRVDKPIRFVAPPPSPTPTPQPTTPACSAADGCVLGTPSDRPQANDLCPAPARGRDLIAGCSQAAILARPELVATPALEDIATARGQLTGMATLRSSFRATATELKQANGNLKQAVRELDRLDMCDASEEAADASADARAAKRAVKRGVKAAERRIWRPRTARSSQVANSHGDVPLRTHEQTLIEDGPGLVSDAAAEISRAAKALRSLCRKTRSARTIKGTITGVLPDGSVTTSGGIKISFDGYDGKVAPVPGVPFTLTGPVLGGVVQAEKITQKATPAPAPPATPRCLTPVLVPAVSFPLKFDRLPFAGYQVGPDTLLLEQGMQLTTVERPNCDPGSGLTHFMSLSIGAKTGAYQGFLTDGERETLNASSPATLIFREIRATCDGTSIACKGELVAEYKYTAFVLETGAAGTAVSSPSVFELVDSPNPPSMGKAKVALQPNVALPNPRLAGLGRNPAVDGGRTIESIQVMGDGQDLAIHPDDTEAMYGPQIVGKRNGSTYVYAAAPATVITDRIATCASTDPFYRNTDAYYSLPWPAGTTAAVGQGAKDDSLKNNEWKNHKNSYAWDFGMPAGTPILAARGGTVTKVEDTYTLNSAKEAALAAKEGRAPRPTPNNRIFIRHRDGTASAFGHMQTGSAKVKVGDRVRRGQVLALTGEVGDAGGPHIHAAILSDPVTENESKQPGLWAGVRVKDNVGTAEPCGIPRQGEQWRSVNQAP